APSPSPVGDHHSRPGSDRVDGRRLRSRTGCRRHVGRRGPTPLRQRVGARAGAGRDDRCAREAAAAGPGRLVGGRPGRLVPVVPEGLQRHPRHAHPGERGSRHLRRQRAGAAGPHLHHLRRVRPAPGRHAEGRGRAAAAPQALRPQTLSRVAACPLPGLEHHAGHLSLWPRGHAPARLLLRV
ncbi:MAG: hypothetical protein AVDCRST_MAG61-1339, partial [uncultured Friedmanniella sp.]